ncbi:MAG: DUF6502 family protein [Bosea sp. (in: a-proteobacteria)]|uniref:DUF6502 family protein n=1 Tax=Bosea sp. (in: a-proteobacteria) TaxID=1871050 RepID=UPI003F7C6BB6
MTEAAPGPTAEKLYPPLARLLRPLVRLCIRAGMTFPALSQLLRELYVNVAEHDFALPGKEQTDSRVSLLTGIHRKEVSRLRGAGAPVNTVPASVSRTGAIIARWLAASRFCDAQGTPLPLPRTTDDGRPSFEELVASVTRDLRPRAVLDEWIDRGIASLDAEDRIVLAEAAFIPQQGDDDKLYYFGRNLHDHLAAAAANVLNAPPPFLERSVHYDGLSAELARHLEARSRELALDLLQRINREANAASAADPGGEHRWNCGFYVFREQSGQADDGGPA